jgi:hypothetical protein
MQQIHDKPVSWRCLRMMDSFTAFPVQHPRPRCVLDHVPFTMIVCVALTLSMDVKC